VTKRKYPGKLKRVQGPPCERCGGTDYFENAAWHGCVRCRYLKNERLRSRRRLDKPLTATMVALGLNRDDIARLITTYGGRCAICDGTNRLVVDHCHASVAFRGILCNSCNVGLGFFKDNPALLSRAIDYLMQNASTF
jgi:hypothetical protein